MSTNYCLAKSRGWLVLAAVAVAGCGGKNYEPPAATAPDSAKTALAAALDAWQAGQATDELSRRPKPIYVGDEDWQAGAKLAGYQIAEPGEQVGLNIVFAVNLEVDRGSRPERKNVRYRVSTEPVASVMRSDKLE